VPLAPLLLLVALWIKLGSADPVFFRQERMGKGFRPFRIDKSSLTVIMPEPVEEAAEAPLLHLEREGYIGMNGQLSP
jgi:lipopolysaccharide/colanic/teichoic acid biosynthesis glycosyltransferase